MLLQCAIWLYNSITKHFEKHDNQVLRHKTSLNYINHAEVYAEFVNELFVTDKLRSSHILGEEEEKPTKSHTTFVIYRN